MSTATQQNRQRELDMAQHTMQNVFDCGYLEDIQPIIRICERMEKAQVISSVHKIGGSYGICVLWMFE